MLTVSQGTTFEPLSRVFGSLHTSGHEPFDCGDIFTGSVIATSFENIDSIQAIPGVANVWPLTTLSTPRSPQFANEPNHDRPKNYSVHHWTGVDILHESGMRGKGTKIAVIDTGVDYSHPAVRQ